MEDQGRTPEKEHVYKPQSPSAQDQSPAAQLARAIAAKDARQVQELVKTVKLTGKYLGSFWSHRVVDNFDPEVAKVMEQARMRLSYPRQLLSLAQYNDDPQAYLWLLEHPSLKEFFSRELPEGSCRYEMDCLPWRKDNKWELPVYQRDKSFVDPFFYGKAPRIMAALLEHPRAEFYKHAIARGYTFYQLAKAGDADGFDLLLTKLVSWFGPQAVRSRLAATVRLYAGLVAGAYFIEMEQQMKTRSNAGLFASIFPIAIDLKASACKWMQATGQEPEKILVNSSAQACLVKASPCCLELMQDPHHAQWYKDMLASKHGVALMSRLAEAPFSSVVSHIIDDLVPAMEKWEKSSHNPDGHTPAQVMMLASAKASLADYFLVHKPEWVTRRSATLGPALDMIDRGGVDARKINSKARLRKKALLLRSKSVRCGEKQKVSTQPKVFM